MEPAESTVVAPSYTELERAIASVPGVVEAHVVVSPETGRGRLRIRLSPGEDPEAVSWAVAATLRERFGIALDPDDIRARTVGEPAAEAPAEGPTSNGEPVEAPIEPAAEDESVEAAFAPATEDEPVEPVTEHEEPTAEHEQPAGPAEEQRQAVAEPAAEDDEPVEAADEPPAEDEEPVARQEPMAAGGLMAAAEELVAAAEGILDREEEPAEPVEEPAAVDEAPDEELRDARERLSEAAQAALARLHGSIGREGADVAGAPRPQRENDALFDVLHGPPTQGQDDRGEEPADTGAESESMTQEREDVSEPEQEGPPEEVERAARPPFDVGEVTDLRAFEAPAATRRRAAVRDLVTRHAPDAVEVVATLRLGEREVSGEARGVPTRAGAVRAVAEATVDALRELTDERLLASVDDVSAVPASHPETVRVVVSVLGDDGEQSLLGAAFVRGDLERAVMRATLDALNRRLEPMLSTVAA